MEANSHTLIGQLFDQRQQIRQGARQAIDRVDVQGIASPNRSQHGLQLRAVHGATAHLVSEHLVQLQAIQLPDGVLVN
ncbi:hypothetical protein D3C76_1171410 [compost metagenome]